MESKIELGLRREECGMTLDVAAYRERLWKLTKLSLFLCVTDFFSSLALEFCIFFYVRVSWFSLFFLVFVCIFRKKKVDGWNFLDEKVAWSCYGDFECWKSYAIELT